MSTKSHCYWGCRLRWTGKDLLRWMTTKKWTAKCWCRPWDIEHIVFFSPDKSFKMCNMYYKLWYIIYIAIYIYIYMYMHMHQHYAFPSPLSPQTNGDLLWGSTLGWAREKSEGTEEVEVLWGSNAQLERFWTYSLSFVSFCWCSRTIAILFGDMVIFRDHFAVF